MITTEEFEEYLISIGGLINGWYPDRDPIVSRGFFELNNGWLELVKNCIEELITVGWNKEILQVKEKFAGLRFYINEGNYDIFSIIEKYEELASNTCEICGTTENVAVRGGGWLVALCDTHAQEREDKRNN